ncbi:MAG: GspE/PulE family protein [Deltaproteobacteria bacterium]|nr:GspE/PulE family protein [Myxococcales bacterium]MDP3220284.1 GspE/PulE family protein [Deltaproteobacteria bacterium]
MSSDPHQAPSADDFSWEPRARYRALLLALREVIAAAASLRALLLNSGDLLHALLDAERVTVFAADERGASLYSVARSGGASQALRVPIDAQSIAGFVALSRRSVLLRDAEDPAQLRALHPLLARDEAREPGVRSVLATPILGATRAVGVLEFVNSLDGEVFRADDQRLAEAIARMIAPKLESLRAEAAPARTAGSRFPPLRGSGAEDSLAQLLAEVGRVRTPENDRDDDARDTDDRDTDSLAARLVRRVVLDAHERGASDVHFEPTGTRGGLRVRLRIDGDCVDHATVPGTFRSSLVQRMKVLADLDLAERRRPQDGRFRIQAGDTPIDVRMATLPTVGENEDVTLRLLSAWRPRPLEEMDFSAVNLARFQSIIAAPYGIVLVVGPTGSGKTTTLHAAVGALNTADRKVLTVEDPVEIVQPGLRQVQANARIGLGFPEVLRAFLRSDPDVILVGEMRDRVTAGVAVEASLTGHLVLSTLQANSAAETVPRLLGMDIDSYAFADALRGVLAQRLVKRLCTHCRAPYAPTPTEWEQVSHAYGHDAFALRTERTSSEFMLHRAIGCARCNGTGYRGRVALHEILPGSGAIASLIRQRATIVELRQAADREGMTTVLQDGIEKALHGITDLGQVRSNCL